MGASAFFCCFNNRNPNCVSFTSIAANIISFGFFIWSLTDIMFSIKKGSKALYIITFVLLCIILLLNLVVFVLINIKKSHLQRTTGSIGKMICLAIIGLCVLCLIFLIIAFIVILVKYVDVEKSFSGKFWPTSDWFAIFLPFILTVIALIIIAKAANYLWKFFVDRVNSANVGQNSITANPTVQPAYEVTVQQN